MYELLLASEEKIGAGKNPAFFFVKDTYSEES